MSEKQDFMKEDENIERVSSGVPGVASYVPVHIDSAIAKRVVRKLDRRVVPWVAFLYLLAFLDRGNIGNAQTAGMGKDLHMSDPQYQWLLTIFYISYILFEPMAFCWKIFPPHRYASVVVLAWGIFAMLQAASKGWAGLMVLRFLMGIAEASYGPGIPYLLSFFYMRRELGVRIGIFLSAAPLASCFAGALAFGIVQAKAGIQSWRLLFLVEGAPTILAAVGTWFILPDSPDTATFLTPEEREVAKQRSIAQVGSETAGHRKGLPKLSEIVAAAVDPKNMLTALIYFSCNVSFSSLPVFLPQILKSMNFTSINAQGLTAPPYFLAFVCVIATTWVADKTQQRGLVIITMSFIGAVGYLLLATCHLTGVRYFAVFLAACGVFSTIGNVLPWVLNNNGSDSKRGTGIAMLNIIGQCGPILGTRVFPVHEAPYYVKGMSICCGFMFFVVILATTLRFYLAWQNRKWDEQYGKKVETEEVNGEENDGPNFRNVL